MADVGIVPFPAHLIMAATTTVPAFATAFTLNVNTTDVSWVWRAPEAITITQVLFRQSALTGAPGTLRVGIQSVSATTGLPTGTWLGGTASGYVDITSYSAGNNNLFVVCTLGESVTVARGDVIAIMLDPQATGTWDGSNSLAVTWNLTGSSTSHLPYGNTGGAKATTTTGVFAIRSASKTYGYPIETIPTINSTSASNPGEFALKFTMPTGSCTSFKIAGARITSNWTTTRNATLVLYDSDGSTVLQNVAFDTDQMVAGQGANEIYFDETTLSTLSPGVAYRLSVQPGATASGTYTLITSPTAQDLLAITGISASYSTRNGVSGAWTDTTTTCPLFQALVSDITATSGGGLLMPRGMTGGVQG